MTAIEANEGARPIMDTRAPHTSRTPYEPPRQALRHPKRRDDELMSRPKNVAPGERILSVLAGGALLAFAVARRGLLRIPAALAGSELLFRGATGRCPVYAALGVHATLESREALTNEVERSITIGADPEEVYRVLREPQTLRRVMAPIAEIRPSGTNRAHWRVRGPLNSALEWETTIVEAKDGELLRWVSMPGARVPQAGLIILRRAPRDLGTELTIRLRFGGPGGVAGALGAKLLALAPMKVVGRAARNLKALVEAGEIPTLKHNPSARDKE
jgi:uncharacterized membrane protein